MDGQDSAKHLGDGEPASSRKDILDNECQLRQVIPQLEGGKFIRHSPGEQTVSNEGRIRFLGNDNDG